MPFGITVYPLIESHNLHCLLSLDEYHIRLQNVWKYSKNIRNSNTNSSEYHRAIRIHFLFSNSKFSGILFKISFEDINKSPIGVLHVGHASLLFSFIYLHMHIAWY